MCIEAANDCPPLAQEIIEKHEILNFLLENHRHRVDSRNSHEKLSRIEQ